MDGRDALQRFVLERARVRGELLRLDETWREYAVSRAEAERALADTRARTPQRACTDGS